MSHKIDEAILLFLALIGLNSPIALVSAYIPLLKPYDRRDQLRLGVGLLVNIAGIVAVTLLVGEPLLEAIGLTTAALTATGGIALMWEAVPLMVGREPQPAEEEAQATDPAEAREAPSWRSILFVPLTFPMSIGGATVGLLVSFRANARSAFAVGALLVAALAYALVTALCVYIAGHAERRLSTRAKAGLNRVAGILLVAIAATLLASGFTRLVVDVLHDVQVL